MASHGAGRSAQVRVWVAEGAADLGTPVSVRLLCEIAAVRLGVGGVTLTMDNSPGWPETRYSTDALGARLAELQVTVGEGPCLDARQEGGPVLVADLGAPSGQQRWPLFAPLGAEAGAGALFALPMAVGAIRVGVLALHREPPGRLEQPVLVDALAFADLALGLLLDEQAGTGSGAGGPAVPGRALLSPQVHQATGMVAAQLDVGMADAFARLRARAFAELRPLSELATDVVSRRLRFEHDGDGS